MCCADKSSVQRSLKKTISSEEKTWQSISSSISCALSIIEVEVALRELLGSSKKSSKNCQNSNESWSDGGSVPWQMFLRTDDLCNFSGL